MVPVYTEWLRKEHVCLWLWSVHYLPAVQPASQHPGRAGGLSLLYIPFVDISLLMSDTGWVALDHLLQAVVILQHKNSVGLLPVPAYSTSSAHSNNSTSLH